MTRWNIGLGAFMAVVGLGTTSSATSSDFTPTAVGCLNTGICYVAVTPNTVTNCFDHTQLRFNATAAGADGMYKAALTAIAAGRKINADATNTCVGNSASPAWLHII
jgi:predicted amino acid dehydrogenase